ncbi:MAG: DUF2889 domain-containing protein [Sphingomonadales bacterium]|nr:DUF2889 domain-containing protein [Sphingomonadales bacterium]
MTDLSPDDLPPAARGLSLTGAPLPIFAEPINAPHGPTPPRRPGSVRRTMSIDAHWPEGFAAPGHYLGRCRDVRTPAAGGAPEVLAEAELRVIAAGREIRAITASPAPEGLERLVGLRAGGHLRLGMAEVIPGEKAAGTPLYLLLDDLAGATFVSNWAYTRWHDDWAALMTDGPGSTVMEGVCIGFRPGADSLFPGGAPRPSTNVTRVAPLVHPDDPAGWHALPVFPGMTFRRARCIELWREGDAVVVDAMFQDSASAPDGGDRFCVHEYRLGARFGPDGLLRALDAVPGTLPYASCRAAPVNNAVLIGAPVRDLREVVLDRLKRTGGCTHLNDALRALAECEALARDLPPLG